MIPASVTYVGKKACNHDIRIKAIIGRAMEIRNAKRKGFVEGISNYI